MEPYPHRKEIDHEVLLRKFVEHLCLFYKSIEDAVEGLSMDYGAVMDDFTFDEQLYLGEIVRFFFMTRNQD